MEALPKKIPAASQGTMNNVAMGGASTKGHWDYYETIAGGGGEIANSGLSGRHSHMTNTLNTPVESLEVHFPCGSYGTKCAQVREVKESIRVGGR